MPLKPAHVPEQETDESSAPLHLLRDSTVIHSRFLHPLLVPSSLGLASCVYCNHDEHADHGSIAAMKEKRSPFTRASVMESMQEPSHFTVVSKVHSCEVKRPGGQPRDSFPGCTSMPPLHSFDAQGRCIIHQLSDCSASKSNFVPAS